MRYLSLTQITTLLACNPAWADAIAEVEVRSDLENFELTFIRRLKENDKIIREKRWNETIARDHQ